VDAAPCHDQKGIHEVKIKLTFYKTKIELAVNNYNNKQQKGVSKFVIEHIKHISTSAHKFLFQLFIHSDEPYIYEYHFFL